MPPPPPPGGSDLQGLFIIRDVDGTEINDGVEYRWNDLNNALNNASICLGNTQYCDWGSIMTAMENGNIQLNRASDLWLMWKWARDLGDRDDQYRVCRLNYSDRNTSGRVISGICRARDLALPLWSKLFLFFSLIVLWLDYNITSRERVEQDFFS